MLGQVMSGYDRIGYFISG